MTRIKLSIAILILLFSIGIGSQIWINSERVALTEITSQAEKAFTDGNKAQAIESAQLLSDEWTDSREFAKLFIRQNKLIEIDRVCARVKSLAENENDELLAELYELTRLIENSM